MQVARLDLAYSAETLGEEEEEGAIYVGFWEKERKKKLEWEEKCLYTQRGAKEEDENTKTKEWRASRINGGTFPHFAPFLAT